MTIEVGKVEMVPISSIVVEDRARQEMGDLEGLEDNMKKSGLISPLAVYRNGDNTYRLLAGERRYTVLKKNNVELIPVRIYDRELSNLEMKVIEKSENLHRKDFEYWEMDALTAEIHKLQQEIYGVKAPGPTSRGWSVEDTGDMLGYSKGSVSTAIKRAEAREAFPELFANCKTQKDASKVIKKMDEAIVKETIAKKLETKNTGSSDFSKLANCYVVGDFFEGVKRIPDSVFHLVEIDPPYAISLQDAKKADGESQYVKSDYNEIPAEDYQVFLSKLFTQCYRVMTEHSWLLCWFAPEPWFEIVYQELNNAGFNTTRMCGIWNKGYGQSKRPEIHLANSYEMFFYAWKGRPALNKAGKANVFSHAPVAANQKVHPTERPVTLMRDMYETFSFPGSRVLIPFLGSGNGIFAADEVGLSPVGFDLSKGYKDSFLVKLNGYKKFV